MYEPKGSDLQYIGSVKCGWECDEQGQVTLLGFEKGSDTWASDAFVDRNLHFPGRIGMTIIGYDKHLRIQNGCFYRPIIVIDL